MAVSLYFPHDEFSDGKNNFDLAADYLELNAFFSSEGQSFTKDLVNATELGAEDDYADVDEEVTVREEVVSGSVARIQRRKQALGDSYPFSIDENGDVLTFASDAISNGRAAYLLCLVLSHLKSMSPVLHGSPIYPTEAEIRDLRQYFQYFATAALAAEVRGQAWSFGFPRPDGTNFRSKLEEIWRLFKDGIIEPQRGAPNHPQDDQIDIFAARMHPDGLPGFMLAAAQVATGSQWKAKSIKSHLTDVFPRRWFGTQPVTDMICYHIIPFTRGDDDFFDDVLVLGNVLHRLRVPYRVEQAAELVAQGIEIEAFDRLPEAVEWISAYSQRGAEAA